METNEKTLDDDTSGQVGDEPKIVKPPVSGVRRLVRPIARVNPALLKSSKVKLALRGAMKENEKSAEVPASEPVQPKVIQPLRRLDSTILKNQSLKHALLSAINKSKGDQAKAQPLTATSSSSLTAKDEIKALEGNERPQLKKEVMGEKIQPLLVTKAPKVEVLSVEILGESSKKIDLSGILNNYISISPTENLKIPSSSNKKSEETPVSSEKVQEKDIQPPPVKETKLSSCSLIKIQEPLQGFSLQEIKESKDSSRKSDESDLKETSESEKPPVYRPVASAVKQALALKLKAKMENERKALLEKEASRSSTSDTIPGKDSDKPSAILAVVPESIPEPTTEASVLPPVKNANRFKSRRPVPKVIPKAIPKLMIKQQEALQEVAQVSPCQSPSSEQHVKHLNEESKEESSNTLKQSLEKSPTKPVLSHEKIEPAPEGKTVKTPIIIISKPEEDFPDTSNLIEASQPFSPSSPKPMAQPLAQSTPQSIQQNLAQSSPQPTPPQMKFLTAPQIKTIPINLTFTPQLQKLGPQCIRPTPTNVIKMIPKPTVKRLKAPAYKPPPNVKRVFVEPATGPAVYVSTPGTSISQTSPQFTGFDLSTVPVVFEDQVNEDTSNIPLIVVPPPQAFPPTPPVRQEPKPSITITTQAQDVLKRIETNPAASLGSVTIRRISKTETSPQPVTVPVSSQNNISTLYFPYKLPSTVQIRKLSSDETKSSPIVLNNYLCKPKSSSNASFEVVPSNPDLKNQGRIVQKKIIPVTFIPTSSSNTIVVHRTAQKPSVAFSAQKLPVKFSSSSITDAKEKSQAMQSQILKNSKLLCATENIKTVNVNVPFVYQDGNRCHKIKLTKITAINDKTSKEVIRNCEQLKGMVGPEDAVQLNSPKLLFPEFEHRDLLLNGFTEHEINISRMRLEFKREHLRKAIETRESEEQKIGSEEQKTESEDQESEAEYSNCDNEDTHQDSDFESSPPMTPSITEQKIEPLLKTEAPKTPQKTIISGVKLGGKINSINLKDALKKAIKAQAIKNIAAVNEPKDKVDSTQSSVGDPTCSIPSRDPNESTEDKSEKSEATSSVTSKYTAEVCSLEPSNESKIVPKMSEEEVPNVSKPPISKSKPSTRRAPLIVKPKIKPLRFLRSTKPNEVKQAEEAKDKENPEESPHMSQDNLTETNQPDVETINQEESSTVETTVKSPPRLPDLTPVTSPVKHMLTPSIVTANDDLDEDNDDIRNEQPVKIEVHFKKDEIPVKSILKKPGKRPKPNLVPVLDRSKANSRITLEVSESLDTDNVSKPLESKSESLEKESEKIPEPEVLENSLETVEKGKEPETVPESSKTETASNAPEQQHEKIKEPKLSTDPEPVTDIIPVPEPETALAMEENSQNVLTEVSTSRRSELNSYKIPKLRNQNEVPPKVVKKSESNKVLENIFGKNSTTPSYKIPMKASKQAPERQEEATEDRNRTEDKSCDITKKTESNLESFDDNPDKELAEPTLPLKQVRKNSDTVSDTLVVPLKKRRLTVTFGSEASPSESSKKENIACRTRRSSLKNPEPKPLPEQTQEPTTVPHRRNGTRRIFKPVPETPATGKVDKCNESSTDKVEPVQRKIESKKQSDALKSIQSVSPADEPCNPQENPQENLLNIENSFQTSDSDIKVPEKRLTRGRKSSEVPKLNNPKENLKIALQPNSNTDSNQQLGKTVTPTTRTQEKHNQNKCDKQKSDSEKEKHAETPAKKRRKLIRKPAFVAAESSDSEQSDTGASNTRKSSRLRSENRDSLKLGRKSIRDKDEKVVEENNSKRRTNSTTSTANEQPLRRRAARNADEKRRDIEKKSKRRSAVIDSDSEDDIDDMNKVFEIVKITSGVAAETLLAETKPKRGRPRRIKTEEPLEKDVDGFKRPPARDSSASEVKLESDTSDDEPLKKRRNLRIGSSSPDLPFNELAGDDSDVNIRKVPKNCYECGACNGIVTKKEWNAHLFNHAGLSWRVGLDPEIDVEDENVCLNMMRRFRMTNNLKFLKCPKCNVEERKSAEGIMSHLRVCGKSASEIESVKVTCPHCNKKYTKDSLPVHIRSHCPVLKQQEKDAKAEEMRRKEQEKLEAATAAPEFSESGRVKRRSVKVAEKKLQASLELTAFKPEDYIEPKAKVVTATIMNIWQNCEQNAFEVNCLYEGCGHSSQTCKEALEHNQTCSLIPGFTCTICKFEAYKRNKVLEHIQKEHKNLDSQSEFSAESDTDISIIKTEVEEDESEDFSEHFTDTFTTDAENENEDLVSNSSKQRSRSDRSMLILREKAGIQSQQLLLFRNMTHNETCARPDVKQLFIQFRTLNYSGTPLFPTFTSNKIDLLPATAKIQYEPLSRVSPDFQCVSRPEYSLKECKYPNDNWTRYKLYQSGIVNAFPTIFCGGPVASMEWLAFPDSYTGPQVLAVSCRLSSACTQNKYLTAESTLLQLWSVKYTNEFVPRLVNPKHIYSIAVDEGPVFDMKSCPSGGYSDNRLGLIAVATFSPDVKIFSLPQPTDPAFEFADTIQAIQLQPAVRLILNSSTILESRTIFPLKVSWSHDKGHTLVAAGYSNGHISVWRLDIHSRLLSRKSRDVGVTEFIPIQTFAAHLEHVTALSFHSSKNAIYLASGGLDRRLKVFQLNANGGSATEIMNSYQKSRVTSIAWSPIMFFYLYGLDTDYCLKQAELRIKNVTGVTLDNQPLFSMSTAITDVAFNPWNNITQFTSATGDVLKFFAKDYNSDSKGGKIGAKTALSYIDSAVLLKLDEASIGADQSLVLPETEQIVFCDINQKQSKQKTNDRGIETRKEIFHRSSLARANRIIFNPNSNAYNVYAVGYESGFVRIHKGPSM